MCVPVLSALFENSFGRLLRTLAQTPGVAPWREWASFSSSHSSSSTSNYYSLLVLAYDNCTTLVKHGLRRVSLRDLTPQQLDGVGQHVEDRLQALAGAALAARQVDDQGAAARDGHGPR